MTLEDIDRALAEWKQKLTAASDNVMALTEDITFRRLSGQGGFPKEELTGYSRDQVQPALAAMVELWQSFALLGDVIEQANSIRKTVPKIFGFGTQEKINDIEHLLIGASVKLQSVKTPLAQRGLLSSAEVTQSVTPTRLLQAMMDAFETARVVVVAVDEAWTRLEPAIGDAEAEAAKLQKLSGALGEGTSPELSGLLATLSTLRQQIKTDPLAVKDGFDRSIRPLLDSLKTRLGAVARQRETLMTDLAACRQSLDAMSALHARCDTAWARCLEVIEQPVSQPRKDVQLLPSLKQRLDNMDSHLAEGTWTCAQVGKGLENWHLQANAFTDLEKKAAQAFEGMVSEREELRGLLLAYKARAEKRGITEDATLIELARQAEFHLYSPRKTPLAVARELVNGYRQRINALTGA